MAKTFIGASDLLFDDNGKLETTSDLTNNENALGEIAVTSGLVGNDKPDVITWASGTNSYVAGTGSITKTRRRALVYNVGSAALLSIADTAGSEKPYVIPDEFVREIVFPFEIAADAIITAKNLTDDDNFGKLVIEFC